MKKIIKLIKVTFEYKNEIHILEDRPQKWMDEINGYIALQALRTSSGGMSKYNWKIIKK